MGGGGGGVGGGGGGSEGGEGAGGGGEGGDGGDGGSSKTGHMLRHGALFAGAARPWYARALKPAWSWRCSKSRWSSR